MARYELIEVGGKVYPAAITNHSLSMGEKLGLIDKSQLPDLLEMKFYPAVIYLGIIGVDKQERMSFQEFLQNYAPDEHQLIQQYKGLILACTESSPNHFAKGLNDSISKKVDKGQKQIKNPKLNLECVEDRYVLYCLGSGIDSDVFWHYPIPDVERIYESKQAYDGWKNNPATY
ncbi:hypothetical protein SAMN05421743_12136 [Thalassobacillus cyri]|uniref:Uncharacterized protein n=1 Tax=Thalassobacillus cyri TaxID=571932 RepID=A0A1H4H3X7_9BACI|nr:hypothetical protein [Thalassobacillus cyri]SEB15732.1 hypothetical protein SAMN05421743_12136 [Thalassobacillus cyri]